MLEQIILAIAAVEAALAVVGWFWKPKQRKFERMLSLFALLLAAASASTAKYTTVSFVIMGCTLMLLVVVFVLKSSLIAYIHFDKHVTQAYVLFDGYSKEELLEIAKTTLVPIGISPILTAQGLEDIARRGEEPGNARAILLAAGKLSVALTADLRMCIDLLITLKRFFAFDGSHEDVADKVTVAAKSGVQPDQLLAALRALQKQRPVAQPLRLDEFLAAIVTLKRREQDVELSGESLAIMIDELVGARASNNGSTSRPTTREYAKKMLSVSDRLVAANARFTKKSLEIQKEIARKGKARQRIFLSGDPVLVGMKEALFAFESELGVIVEEAEGCKTPPELARIHTALLESFRKQLDGVARARAGVERIDFAEVSRGLELHGEGIANMQEQAARLSRLVLGR